MIYYLKQLIPCMYRTVYHEEHNGSWRPIYHTWRMWFGCVFDEEKVVIAEALTPDVARALRFLDKGPPPGI